MKTKNDTLNAIQTMVDSAVNKAGYDKTRNAVVIARNANNTYKIKMDGIEYDNVVFYGSGEAQVNEVVKVVIPNNQASQMYVMGKGGNGGIIASDSNPIGSVIAFAGNNAPVGYLMCDGSAVSRETYADLFAVIGTTYGSGDGSTTFNLPNYPDTKDYIVEEGIVGGSNNWKYRKWASGLAELWGYTESSASPSGTLWTAPMYYFDNTLTLPSGIFVSAPFFSSISMSNKQWTVVQVEASSATSIAYRLIKPVSSAQSLGTFKSYSVGYWKTHIAPPSKKHIIKATHNVTIQGVDTMSEAEYQDLLERLV